MLQMARECEDGCQVQRRYMERISSRTADYRFR